MQHAQVARYQRLKLLLIFIVFAAPMAAAWGMVKWGVGIPVGHKAHGEVNVAVPNLTEWPLVNEPESLGEAWTLAFDCLSDCEQRKDELWRLHRALGREAPRLQRLRIGGAEHTLPGELVTRWQEAPSWYSQGAIWLMDPMGNPALVFKEQTETTDILGDIRHLFKVNHH